MRKFCRRKIIRLPLLLLILVGLVQLGKHQLSTNNSNTNSKSNSTINIYSGNSIRNNNIQLLKTNVTNKDSSLGQSKIQKCENADEKRITEFYTGFTNKTNIKDTPIKMLPVDVCASRIRKDPYLVIIIASVPGHISMRNTIRETWASYKNVGNISMEGNMINKTIGLVFILGRFIRPDTSADTASRESRVYGDILQVDIEESHDNLVYKVLAGLKWVANNCKGSKYLLKNDEDVYVHLPRLFRKLQLHDGKDAIIGFKHPHLDPKSKPLRHGKYKLTFEQYKFCRFLSYAEGNAYVISAGLVQHIVHWSMYIPPNKIEDHYFTGILRSVVSAPLINDKHFSRALPSIDKSKVQYFYKYRKISETRCTEKDIKISGFYIEILYLRENNMERSEQRK